LNKTSGPLITIVMLMLYGVTAKCTRSYATAKSTARPSCLVGVLHDIYRETIWWRLINHFT